MGKSNHLRPTILVEVSKPEMGFRMYHVSRLKSPKRSMQRFSLFFSEFAETARFGVMLLSESNSGACRVLGFGFWKELWCSQVEEEVGNKCFHCLGYLTLEFLCGQRLFTI